MYCRPYVRNPVTAMADEVNGCQGDPASNPGVEPVMPEPGRRGPERSGRAEGFRVLPWR